MNTISMFLIRRISSSRFEFENALLKSVKVRENVVRKPTLFGQRFKSSLFSDSFKTYNQNSVGLVSFLKGCEDHTAVVLFYYLPESPNSGT